MPGWAITRSEADVTTLYRCITEDDTSQFCHRVSEALMFGRTPAGTASGSKEKTKEQAGTLLD